MKREKAEYVKRRYAHAIATLKEVDIQVENELWNVAVNRLYYACYYAVTALLHNNDMDTKTHKGAQRIFSLHFIKPGIINEGHGKLYTTLLDMRQEADYEDEVEYDKDDVQQLLKPAKDLIAAIETILLKSE